MHLISDYAARTGYGMVGASWGWARPVLIVLPAEGVLFCCFGEARVWHLASLVHASCQEPLRVSCARSVLWAAVLSKAPMSGFGLASAVLANLVLARHLCWIPWNPVLSPDKALLTGASQGSHNCLEPRQGTPACRTAVAVPCNKLQRWQLLAGWYPVLAGHSAAS